MKLVFSEIKDNGINDYWSGLNDDLTDICKTFFWRMHNIFLIDGHDGNDDGLVEFKVKYNSFYKMYRFSFIGGSEYKAIAQELENWFKKNRYEIINNKSHTWLWIGKKLHNGIYFEVKARKR